MKGNNEYAIKHTNTTRCYISSNHDGTLASLELIQDPITLILLLVTVDGCIVPSAMKRLRKE